jgi:rod shape-determining protein MreD
MSGGAANLAPWRWIGVPMLQCLGLTVLLAIPLRVFGLQLPEPIWAMWPMFAWAMIRPSILAPFAVLLTGLFLDIFWGGPMGFWGLSLLVGYGAVLGARSMMIGQGAPMMWAWFATVTAIVMAAGAFVALLATHATPSLASLLWQFLATIILYPLSHRLIERFEDADVRFR